MRKYIFTAIIIISIILTGCDTNDGTVNLTVNEKSAEITEVTNETVHMNNCGSAGEVKQIAEKSKSVNVEYVGSLGVGKVIVNGEVSAKYGEMNSNAKKIELVAPAGTNMEFNLKWTDRTWLGIVTARGKDGHANYKVSVPISVELVSSQNLRCGTPQSQEPINTTPTEIAITPKSGISTNSSSSLSILNITNNKPYSFDFPPTTNSPGKCPGAYLETGMTIIEYKFNIPKSWVVVIDSWKADWSSGSYQNNGILILTGEWQGNVEINIGAICVIPTNSLESTLEIRRNLTKNDGRPEYTVP